MRCFSCQSEIGEENICPACGNDQTVYKKILNASNAAYNEGLGRAKIKDLSGAADVLQKSLRFNKYNTDARNLLGLVYFEVGQTVLAIKEWVLSKNLQPENNLADEYLAKVQKPGVLNKLDAVTQKYNQALEYCRNGSRDLARIQLKRVISDSPNMVSAYQLLALILMQDGKYAEARKYISQAGKIDYKNAQTMAYAREIRRVYQNSTKKKKKRKAADPIDFNETAEVTYTPRNQFVELLDSAGAGILNVVIGAIIGILAAIFLIVPTMRQNANSSAANALVSANQEAADSANNVATLQNRVEDLEEELSNYTGKGDMQTSYEKLLEAKTKMDEEDTDAAIAAIDTVNRELLSDNGKAMYDALYATVNEAKVTKSYEEGMDAYDRNKFDEAAPLLQIVVDADPRYDDGYALYHLAECYEGMGDNEKAVQYYTQFVNEFPGTKRATLSKNKIEELTGEEYVPTETSSSTAQEATEEPVETTNTDYTEPTEYTEEVEEPAPEEEAVQEPVEEPVEEPAGEE